MTSSSPAETARRNSASSYDKLCDQIFEIDPSIRFAGVLDRMGGLVAGGMRKGIKPIESGPDAARFYLEFALRNAMRHDSDPEFGRVLYAFSEREKIKFATFPLGEDLVLVSIEKAGPHERIIRDTLKLLAA